MNLYEITPPPSKRLLLLRLFFVIALSIALVESAGFALKNAYPQQGELFEVIEDLLLVIILFSDIYYLLARPMFTEIARRVAVEDMLRKSESDKRAILDALPDTLLRVSQAGVLIDYKLETEAVMNVGIGKHVSDLFPEPDVQNIMNCITNAINRGGLHRLEIVLSEGTAENHQLLRFAKLGGDEVLILISNITGRKRYEEQLKFISTHDVLTGLYNRTFYEAQLERLGKGRQYPIGIIVIDLDGLKETNDTYGHAAGDRMISKAAEVLKKVFRADDLVSRTGGDEFTILLTETSCNELQLVVNRIYASLDEVNEAEPEFELRFSLGSAIAASKELLSDAVRGADVRMYEDKAERKAARL